MKRGILRALLTLNLSVLPALGALTSQHNGEVFNKIVDQETLVETDYEWESIPAIEAETIEVEPVPYMSDPPHTRTGEVITEWWKVNGEIPNNPSIPDYYEELCVKWGIEYQICPELLCSMCKTESEFNEKAQNGQYWGVMQVGTKVHKQRIKNLGYETDDMLNADACIHVAADLMVELVEKYNGDIGAALIAYNQGNCANYQKTGKLTKYATTILERSAQWERENGK